MITFPWKMNLDAVANSQQLQGKYVKFVGRVKRQNGQEHKPLAKTVKYVKPSAPLLRCKAACRVYVEIRLQLWQGRSVVCGLSAWKHLNKHHLLHRPVVLFSSSSFACVDYSCCLISKAPEALKAYRCPHSDLSLSLSLSHTHTHTQ